MLILHLSDLHFGPRCRLGSGNVTLFGHGLARSLRQISSQLDLAERISLLCITGDLTGAARPHEFETALAFLRAVSGALGLEDRRVVTVPGNHDVSWTACQRVVLDQHDYGFDDGELLRRFGEVKLQRFLAFQRQLYGCDLTRIAIPLGHHSFLHEIPELDLSVAALSSCQAESHRPQDRRGVIAPAVAQALADQWLDGDARHRLKIICLHHNPNGFPAALQSRARQELQAELGLAGEEIDRYAADLVAFEGRELLEQIVRRCRVQLVLHGHQQEVDQAPWPWQDQGVAHVLAAGSLWPASGRQRRPASARLVRIDPGRACLQAYNLLYGSGTAAGDRAAGELIVAGDCRQPDLYLPEGWTGAVSPVQGLAETDSERLAAFLRTYRDRLQDAHARWHPSVSPATVTDASRQQAVPMDEIYIPLRLAQGYDVDCTGHGKAIDPETLLARTRPLVVCGLPGAGKTTWMRWTFRQLLGSRRAVPLLIEMRALAHRWADPACTGSQRTIEAFLEHEITSHLGSGWRGMVPMLLAERYGLRPVLLMDGWEELGELCGELQDRLVALLDRAPHLAVVISSRRRSPLQPLAGTRFEVLDIQPLHDGEIRLLAWHFARRCHGADKEAAQRQTLELRHALAAAPGTRSLARNALHLCMMLVVNRRRSLPEKRHRLCQAYLEALVDSATPAPAEGACWWPGDGAAQLRRAAALAFKVQSEGYRRRQRSLPRTWEELASLLPEEWPQDQRHRFLACLAGAATLLADRADGTVVFSHLVFQEYLAAWHLDATCEGRDRSDVFLALLGDSDWWDTLVLWAARIERHNPGHLATVLEALAASDNEQSLAVAGMLHADGLGSDAFFNTWLQRLAQTPDAPRPDEIERCARAWTASHQTRRKQLLAETIAGASGDDRWSVWRQHGLG